MTWWILLLAWTAVSLLVALGYSYGVMVGRRRGQEEAAAQATRRRRTPIGHERRLTG